MDKDQITFFKETTDPKQTKIHKGAFPLIWSPNECRSFISLQQTVEANRQRILHKISDVGAILFRGFDILSANEYVSILHKLGLSEFEYIGGAAVRHLIVGSAGKPKSLQVFTTNQSPPTEPIPLHNELAQNENYPEFISFYCHVPAHTGGSTPIINCHQLFKYVEKKHPKFVAALEEKGVRYIRVVEEQDNPSSPIGRGWRNIFHVATKQEAEAKMNATGYEWEWMDSLTNDCKLISKNLPAVRTAKNGEKVFCNQLLAVFKGWIDQKNSPLLCLKYGDYSDMPIEVLEDVCMHAQKEVASIQWQKGDFIIIDNEVVAHSREPFEGLRKIYASLMKGRTEVKNGPRLTLNSGDLMPVQGLGTWKIEKEHCAQSVYKAIEAGYRLIDCACDYGNEEQVGEGISKALQDKLVKREDLFVTSKLWNTYHRKEHVKQACLKSLKDLKLDYLDLYHIHFPISLKFVPFEHRYPPQWFHQPKAKNPSMMEDHVPIMETWRAMEELVKQGLVKNIGVCNFGISLLRDLINSSLIKPSVLQVEIHPYLSQKKLIQFCRQHGIQITAYSSFGANSYISLGGATEKEMVVSEESIKELAKKYKKSQYQIVLRWAVQQGLAIIPKSSKIERIRENFDVSGWTIDEEDMNVIDKLNKNKRFNDPGVFCEGAFNTFFPIYE